MLTRGNHKLGGRLIWSFSLPSARPDVCVGMSGLCSHHCYARRLERLRPAVLAHYEANHRLSLDPAFAALAVAFIAWRGIAVVRLHVGGDFFSREYARKWLRVMRRSPQVRFYFYTRAWRVESIRDPLESMAALPNCRAWYSCDRETGVPSDIPPGVRLTWLSAGPGDAPPPSAGLVFRTRGLRREEATHVGGVRVCPAEDGVPRGEPVTCERCGSCWQPLAEAASVRVSLPLLPDPAPVPSEEE